MAMPLSWLWIMLLSEAFAQSNNNIQCMLAYYTERGSHDYMLIKKINLEDTGVAATCRKEYMYGNCKHPKVS